MYNKENQKLCTIQNLEPTNVWRPGYIFKITLSHSDQVFFGIRDLRQTHTMRQTAAETITHRTNQMVVDSLNNHCSSRVTNTTLTQGKLSQNSYNHLPHTWIPDSDMLISCSATQFKLWWRHKNKTLCHWRSFTEMITFFNTVITELFFSLMFYWFGLWTKAWSLSLVFTPRLSVALENRATVVEKFPWNLGRPFRITVRHQ